MTPYLRTIATVLLAAACATGGAAAQSNDPAPPTGTTEAEPSAAPPNVDVAKKYLLLVSGRVIEGDVAKSPAGGYLLKRGGATIRYEDSMVVALADTLEQLYAIRVGMVPAHDLDERFKIADWCLANKMPELACRELEAILKIDPSNVTAQRRYRRLTRPESTADHSAAKKKAEAARPVMADPSQVIADFKAAHGQKSFEHFRIVEAMLINRCGAAGCHGSPRHPGEFKLIKPREGNLADAKMTARNLQSVLAVIDLQQPTKSPVLTMALQGRDHGLRGQSPLAGINDPIFQDLKEWVFHVSESSTVERAQGDTPSRRRLALRNRSFGGKPAPQVVHPLWMTESGARGRIVLEDGTIREYGTPADARPNGNSRPSYAAGNRNNEGGDDVPRQRPGFGANAADDAPPTSAGKAAMPPPAARKSAVPQGKSAVPPVKSAATPSAVPNSEKGEAKSNGAAPAKSADPNDPSQFNSQAGAASAGSSAIPRRSAGKSAVPKSIMLDTKKRGQLFEAAPGPITGRQPQ